MNIETDSGKSLKAIYTSRSYEDKNEENTVYLTDIGLLERKYFFPFQFAPFIYFEKVEGERIKLETYEDEYNHRYSQLWLLNHLRKFNLTNL